MFEDKFMDNIYLDKIKEINYNNTMEKLEKILKYKEIIKN